MHFTKSKLFTDKAIHLSEARETPMDNPCRVFERSKDPAIGYLYDMIVGNRKFDEFRKPGEGFASHL